MLQAKIYIQINTFINKFLNYIYILYKDFDMYLHKLHYLNNNQILYLRYEYGIHKIISSDLYIWRLPLS